MNKKFFLGITALAVAFVSGYNVYRVNVNSVKLSDLAMANVEALSMNETNPNGYCYSDVRTEIESKCNEGVTEYDGIPIRCIENHIDEIAYLKRKYVDDYNMGQHTAVREALDDYIASIL